MSGNAVRLAFERRQNHDGIRDLRFHYFRHEAISRFFEKGQSTIEVSAISGHKQLRMLSRYTHSRVVGVKVAADGEITVMTGKAELDELDRELAAFETKHARAS